MQYSHPMEYICHLHYIIYWDDPQSVQLGNTNNIWLDYLIFVSRRQECMSIGLQKYSHPATWDWSKSVEQPLDESR